MTHELLNGLNPDQLEAAQYRGNCLTIATAGSGKTKMLASKAGILLREGARVGAVTFTKKAALEMRERIVKAAGPDCRSRLLVGTYHSIDLVMAFPEARKSLFGSAILKDMRSPFKKKWVIANDGVLLGYVIRAMKDSGADGMDLDDALRIIEQAKAKRSTSHLDETEARMVEVYNDLLTRNGEIDMQDIILKTNAALRSGEMTPLALDYLLLDEYQDTDESQFEWAGFHARAGTSVTAVGDDDQSIYAFRRALGYEGLVRFAETYGAHRVMLGINYRCRPEILKAAERLISRNTERLEKRLVAAKDPGGLIVWNVYPDTYLEATAAAEAAGAAFRDGQSFAILARTRKRLDESESALISMQIPYTRTDGKSIFSYPEVQAYAALLRTIIKPVAKDVDQVLAWAGMQEQDLKIIHELFGNTIRVGAPADFSATQISPEGVEVWRSFAKRHAQWVNLNKNECFVLLNDGVLEWLKDQIRKPNSPRMLEVAHALFNPKGESLEARLKAIADAERLRKQPKDLDEERTGPPPVELVTAHGSKGLEYQQVWIIGLEEGAFPDSDSSLEEERRLMFVAITRAQERLFMSASAERRPSFFVAETGILDTVAG